MENKEIWKDIEGFEGKYQISSMGKVKSLWFGKEKILKNIKTDRGYIVVSLYKEGKQKNYYIHRLVAQTFLPNPDNLPQVNHRNENKTDNRVDNLEYCDSKYNNNFGTRTERAIKSKSIPILQFSKDGELVQKWDSVIEASRELGFYHSSIIECCKGRRKSAGGYRWKYYYKGIWLKNHIPLIKQKKVA